MAVLKTFADVTYANMLENIRLSSYNNFNILFHEKKPTKNFSSKVNSKQSQNEINE